VIGPGWLAFFLLILTVTTGQTNESTMRSFLLAWSVGCVLYAGWLGRERRSSLARDFRRLASNDRRPRSVSPTPTFEVIWRRVAELRS
jgi:hypothetical protein